MLVYYRVRINLCVHINYSITDLLSVITINMFVYIVLCKINIVVNLDEQ